MEPELLETMGKTGGIAGLALGVLLILFRDLLRKRLFAKLSAAATERLLTRIVVLVWLLALAALGVWAWTAGDPGDADGGGADVSVNGGVYSGGNIEGSTINIAPAHQSATQPDSHSTDQPTTQSGN